MWRSVACLALGALLWLQLGAVAGASRWQLSGSQYLVGLGVAGTVAGLLWPDRHMRTGLLVVAPGAVGLFWLVIDGDPTDTFWWVLTLIIGVYVAAGGHWVAVELRRGVARLRRWSHHP